MVLNHFLHNLLHYLETLFRNHNASIIKKDLYVFRISFKLLDEEQTVITRFSQTIIRTVLLCAVLQHLAMFRNTQKCLMKAIFGTEKILNQ
jgi:hypothetical protein